MAEGNTPTTSADNSISLTPAQEQQVAAQEARELEAARKQFEHEQTSALAEAKRIYKSLGQGKVPDTTPGVSEELSNAIDKIDDDLHTLGLDHRTIVPAATDEAAFKAMMNTIAKAYPGKNLSVLEY